jgi:hydroxyacylglutathione hydrolase
MIQVTGLPAFTDNYFWAFWNPTNPQTVGLVDPGDADVVLDWLDSQQRQLEVILLTHHHPDHVGGVPALKEAFPNVKLIGPFGDAPKIGFDYEAVDEGDELKVLGACVEVLGLPGHTLGHIAYWFSDDFKVFVGDTVFSSGCGRLFEGTPEQMWTSLKKIRALPASTEIYCAHEYTESNCRFAMHLEPENPAVVQRAEQVGALRLIHKPTVPTTVAEETRWNPFLRSDSPEMSEVVSTRILNQPERAGHLLPEQVFAELRKAKDSFR